ncbi:MAG: CvpA family protein [Deltaproteobacteria bacterium]|nr:CvpA family protein [Deltaproteobacteria bacterium]
MNLLDIVIICTMAFFVVKGIFRGFIRETASLAGVILGILLAAHFQPRVTGYLKAYLPTTPFLSLISFAGVFICVLVLCNLLGWALKLLSQKASLGWADRGLGVGLALLKGVIVTYLAIVLLTLFVPSRTPLIAGSNLAPLIVASYQSMVRLISPDHYEGLKKRFLGRDWIGKDKDPQKPKGSVPENEQG